jgi:hypothetical protein
VIAISQILPLVWAVLLHAFVFARTSCELKDAKISFTMTTLAQYGERALSSLKEVGGFVLPLVKPSPVIERFLTFQGTLDDWHTACKRFDEHFHEWRSCLLRLSEWFEPGVNQLTSAEKSEFLARWGTLGAEVRFDIRCFYIFSKIPFISFSSVLYAMAGNPSVAWHSATRVMKAVKKETAPRVFKDFHAKFEQDMRWFDGYINLYRNAFVEHPFPVAIPGGIISDEKGAKLAGLTGKGISKEDEALMLEIEAVSGDSFSGLSALPPIERYFHVCRNFGHVPESHRKAAEKMIQAAGLESGELETIAARLAEMFSGFASFFAAWKNENLTDVEIVGAAEIRREHA